MAAVCNHRLIPWLASTGADLLQQGRMTAEAKINNPDGGRENEPEWWDARPLLGRGTGSQRADLRLRATYADSAVLREEIRRQIAAEPNRPIFAPLTPLWAEAWPVKDENLPPLHLALPDVRGLVREATEHGVVGAGMRRVLRMGIFNFILFGIQNIPEAPLVLQKKFPAYFRILVRLELASAKRLNPTSVLLHQPMTDLAVAMGNPELLNDFIRIAKKRGFTPGFLTANSSACRKILPDTKPLIVNVRSTAVDSLEQSSTMGASPKLIPWCSIGSMTEAL